MRFPSPPSDAVAALANGLDKLWLTELAPELPSEAQLVRFSACMRVNGIPDFPDPVDGNLSYNRGAGGDLNPDNPTFQHASELCVEKTGAHVPGAGSPPPGTIEINGASPPGT